MRSAIAHLSFSIEKLDASLSKYSSKKDGSQDLRDSLNQYQEATNLFNQVNGMSSALASRMQISEKISEMERIDFLTGDMRIFGDAARKELLEQKEKLAGALRDLQTNMGQAFFEFATGSMDEGQMMLSEKSKRIAAKVEKEATSLNELFSVARNFEYVLFLTSEEAERLLTVSYVDQEQWGWLDSAEKDIEHQKYSLLVWKEILPTFFDNYIVIDCEDDNGKLLSPQAIHQKILAKVLEE